jgi:hypothetical protein
MQQAKAHIKGMKIDKKIMIPVTLFEKEASVID